jgi:hypothetical protein
MKILALEREKPGISPGQFQKHSENEAHRVWELIQEEVIREIYFQRDENSAVIILECANIQEARQILNTLPLVEAGLIDFELIPLRAYPGLARLFKERRDS